MRRGQKRRSQPWRAGSENANVRAGQVDSTLESLLVNFMALPDNSTFMVTDTVMAMTTDARMYLTAITEIIEDGGQPRLKAALNRIARRGCM